MPEYPQDELVEVGGFWEYVSKAGRKYWKCTKPRYDSLEKFVDMANRGELSFIIFPVDKKNESSPTVRLYFSWHEKQGEQGDFRKMDDGQDSGGGFGDF